MQITVTSKVQGRFNETYSKVPRDPELDGMMDLADQGGKTPEFQEAREFEEVLDGDAGAGESTEPVATPVWTDGDAFAEK